MGLNDERKECKSYMKKIVIILLVTSLIIFSFIFIKTTYSNEASPDQRFPDKNFYNCVASSVDATGINTDGTINDSNLNQLSSLSCQEKNITSAKGIELMPNLTYLNLNENELTELDVTKNVKLKELDLYDN